MTRKFDAKIACSDTVKYIQDYVKQAGCHRVVMGISGGKDSTVVAMLAVEALGKENVFGVMMPNGVQKDIADSLEVADTLDINYIVEDMFDGYDFFKQAENEFWDSLQSCKGYVGMKRNPEAMLNVTPRLRMTSLYNKAALINALVIGTGNQCERLVGYFTKYGDGGCDFNPIGLFTVSEVVAMGKVLAARYNMREALIDKTPSDGLSDVSDEEKLGVTYAEIDNFLRGNQDLLSESAYVKILKLESKSKHKRNMPDMYDYYSVADNFFRFMD